MLCKWKHNHRKMFAYRRSLFRWVHQSLSRSVYQLCIAGNKSVTGSLKLIDLFARFQSKPMFVPSSYFRQSTWATKKYIAKHFNKIKTLWYYTPIVLYCRPEPRFTVCIVQEWFESFMIVFHCVELICVEISFWNTPIWNSIILFVRLYIAYLMKHIRHSII